MVSWMSTIVLSPTSGAKDKINKYPGYGLGSVKVIGMMKWEHHELECSLDYLMISRPPWVHSMRPYIKVPESYACVLRAVVFCTEVRYMCITLPSACHLLKTVNWSQHESIHAAPAVVFSNTQTFASDSETLGLLLVSVITGWLTHWFENRADLISVN